MTIAAIPSDPFTRRLQKIGQMIANKDLQKAATELNAAVKTFPTDPRVFLQAARLAEASGNVSKAEEAARKAVSLNPVWVVSVTELASLLSRLQRHPEALEQGKKALALDPDNVDVLARVADIAQLANDMTTNVKCLRKLAELRPGMPVYKSLLARNLRLAGDNASALAVYNDMLTAHATDRDGLLGRAQLNWFAGQKAAAVADCETLLTLEPGNETFRFWHTLVQGGVPATMPEHTVRTIFDNEAPHYDASRLQGMNYQLPKVMAELIKARQADPVFHTLDLGCGTGLLGAHLGKSGGALVGVDLSRGMVDQAAKHRGLYDKFHTVNVLDALEATPADLYHVIAACDVFSYVGDLTQAIPNAFRVVRPDGHLVFSCELAQESEADLVIRPTLRFAHKRSAVEAMCRAAGFDKVDVVDTPLFNDSNVPVDGYIVIAHKPA